MIGPDSNPEDYLFQGISLLDIGQGELNLAVNDIDGNMDFLVSTKTKSLKL